MKKVIVFGSFVVDLMARSAHLPTKGETIKGTMFRMGPGGKGFNQCVAAHKAGADVLMVTKVGKDTFADVAFSTMRMLSMPSDNIFVSNSTETGVALIFVDEKTCQNEIVIVPGACNTITKEDIFSIEYLMKDAEYILLQLEVNQDANNIVADLAQKHGCKIILNSAPYAPLSDDFLSKIYMVTPNEIEAEQITGVPVNDLASAKKAAKYFKEKGVKVVIITLGSKGIFVSSATIEEIIPAFHAEAVDTTGAGDAFNGGLLAALSKGKSLIEAVTFGQAVAALSVKKIGTTASMPTYEEILEFLHENQISM